MICDITINGGVIGFGAFDCKRLGQVAAQSVDVTPLAGRRHARIWLDPDGTYSCDPRRQHYWQVAELDVPEQVFCQVAIDDTDPDTGEPITRAEAAPLDIDAEAIQLWELPE
ncbi:MAG: hypothetical protein JRE40_10675 [Deltaproteobacteria bacterium]|nr:hypothetical protein [Deltaproteobacteria bacterium]MBW2673198.1 hypothetical protein [Deltaproteobacteria bacterium]